jgi:hypothetical protein
MAALTQSNKYETSADAFDRVIRFVCLNSKETMHAWLEQTGQCIKTVCTRVLQMKLQ